MLPRRWHDIALHEIPRQGLLEGRMHVGVPAPPANDIIRVRGTDNVKGWVRPTTQMRCPSIRQYRYNQGGFPRGARGEWRCGEWQSWGYATTYIQLSQCAKKAYFRPLLGTRESACRGNVSPSLPYHRLATSTPSSPLECKRKQDKDTGRGEQAIYH